MRGDSTSQRLARMPGSSARKTRSPCRTLQEKGADLIADPRALSNQTLTHPVQCLQIQLVSAFRGHELHRRALHRLGDRLRIAEVVLLPLRIWTDVLGRHQPGIVTKSPQLATEVMSPDTRLHADQARRHIGKPCFHLPPRPLLPQHDCATTLEADDVERVLPDIDTDHGDHTARILSHGCAPFIDCLLSAYC